MISEISPEKIIIVVKRTYWLVGMLYVLAKHVNNLGGWKKIKTTFIFFQTIFVQNFQIIFTDVFIGLRWGNGKFYPAKCEI